MLTDPTDIALLMLANVSHKACRMAAVAKAPPTLQLKVACPALSLSPEDCAHQPCPVGEDGIAATIARVSGGEAGDVAKQAADAVTGRFAPPEEVADLIVLLTSEGSGNVTGADFLIDGALIATL